MGELLKILICSSEVVPFAKTGGLADVAGALPLALSELGHEVRVAIKRAVAAYQDQEAWRRLMRTGMKQDFSWMRSAREYVRLYRKALSTFG